MTKKWVLRTFKTLGLVLTLAVLGAGLAWVFRSDPILMVSGRTLSGEESPYPKGWGFSQSHDTIAVETRPEDPHSVTTLCFLHEGDLYVPAQSGSSKRWTHYVLKDPRVRLKVGGEIYRATAMRVLPLDLGQFRESIGRKYPVLGNRSPDEMPEDVWLFRIGPRGERSSLPKGPRNAQLPPPDGRLGPKRASAAAPLPSGRRG